MKGEELIRIEGNINGEDPGTTRLIITAKNVKKKADDVLKNIKEIMKCISKYAYTNTWPSDEEWKNILPKWFVESMTLKTDNDLDTDDDLWHYESWIDNMRMRSWVWWSSKKQGNDLIFVLETLDIPYLYETFLYVLYSQGVAMNDIIVEDETGILERD